MISTGVSATGKSKQGPTTSEMPSREALLATGNQSQAPLRSAVPSSGD